ncbi:hypothetical protein Dimus_006215 [Dionaea muscipula]
MPDASPPARSESPARSAEGRREWALRQLGMSDSRRSPSPRPPPIGRDPPSPRLSCERRDLPTLPLLGTDLSQVREGFDSPVAGSIESSIGDERLSNTAAFQSEAVGNPSLVSGSSIGAAAGTLKDPEGSLLPGPHAPGGSSLMKVSSSIGVVSLPKDVGEVHVQRQDAAGVYCDAGRLAAGGFHGDGRQVAGGLGRDSDGVGGVSDRSRGSGGLLPSVGGVAPVGSSPAAEWPPLQEAAASLRAPGIDQVGGTGGLAGDGGAQRSLAFVTGGDRRADVPMLFAPPCISGDGVFVQLTEDDSKMPVGNAGRAAA